MELINNIWLPLSLGLFGFIEPCSIGSNLLFIKYMEGKRKFSMILQAGIFTAARALLMGSLGLIAGLLGSIFLKFQKGTWIVFGSLYVIIGIIHLLGKSSLVFGLIQSKLAFISGSFRSAGLGLLFAFNIPACAAPLIFVLLGTAASSANTGETFLNGFFSLAIFGTALSLPLLIGLIFPPVRRGFDWLAGLSVKIPLWTSVVLILVGIWSIYFGLFMSIEKYI